MTIQFFDTHGQPYDQAVSLRLGDFTTFSKGAPLPDDVVEGEFPLYTAGRGVTSFISRCNHQGDVVIIPEMGAGGAGYVRWASRPFWNGANNFAIEVDSEKVVSRFLYYSLVACQQRFSNSVLAGTAQPYVIKEAVRAFSLRLPPLPEQKKIASFLGLLDDQVENQRERMRLLEDQKRGYMQRLFSRELRFRDDNGNEYPEWGTSQVGELAKVYQPETVSVDSSLTGGFPKYGANGIIGFSETYNHETPQIVVGCRGNCGVVHLTVGYAWINGNAMVVNVDGKEDVVEKRWLYQRLRFFDFSPFVTGSAQPQLTRTPVQRLPLALPSLPEQKKIADFLGLLDDQIENQKERLRLLEEQKKGYLQALFPTA